MFKKFWKIFHNTDKHKDLSADNQDVVDECYAYLKHSSKEAYVEAIQGVRMPYNARFLNVDGKAVNVEDYKKFVVHGDSLDIFNIKHNDLIFIEEKSGSEIEKFPAICVFNRADYLKDYPNNKAKYLINKVWLIVEPTCRIEDVINIIMSSDFDKIRNDTRFVSNEYIYEHVNWDFETDGDIVLTTRLNEEDKFIMEFKRLSDIIGVAKYCYTMKNQ